MPSACKMKVPDKMPMIIISIALDNLSINSGIAGFSFQERKGAVSFCLNCECVRACTSVNMKDSERI